MFGKHYLRQQVWLELLEHKLVKSKKELTELLTLAYGFSIIQYPAQWKQYNTVDLLS